VNILEAIDDPNLFAPWFRDPATWTAWRAFLCALFALPMSDADRELFTRYTGRATAPATPFSEAYLVCGRRAGKSAILALVAVYLATFKSYAPYLAPGERGTIAIIAADRKQARVIFRYLASLLRDVPMLAQLIDRETAESFDLTNRVTIEVSTASYRTARGYTFIAILADELAFWRSDDSANPDTEVLAAVRPGMSTIPGAMLLCASSPYARKGALWEAFQRYHGDDNARVLVWRAPTRAMNPTVSAETIDEAIARDPAAAAAEYLAEFRTDVESFVSLDAVRACITPGVGERPHQPQWRYVAFCDPSGGSADSMTLAIAHKEGSTAILDVVREAATPFSPEAIVEEFSDLMRNYRITRVVGDRYGGDWPREQFRKNGINYQPSERAKSQLYVDLLPLINSRAVDLLDHDRVVLQLVGLERRTGRGGRDSIDHGPGGHDDLSNAVAGALTLAAALTGTYKDFRRQRPRPSPPVRWPRASGPYEAGTGWMRGWRR
jgi:hypothetical protein